MKKSLLLSLCLLLPFAYSTAHPGIGIVMDSKGNVFYTDLVHVWKISANGQRSIAVKNVHTHELYIDREDNLYGEHEWYEGEATDKWGNYVWCLHSNGVLQKIIPDIEGFLTNTTLVRDTEGNSYWTAKEEDYETLMMETNNGIESRFCNHQFKDIRWMHFSQVDNMLYIVDHLRIKKVSGSGEVTAITGILKEGERMLSKVDDRHYVYGIWTDNAANVYVALYGAGKVQRIDLEGQMETVFESKMGWSPCGGLTADDGTMWIMEFSFRNKTRVRRISTNGQSTLFED